MVEKLPAGLFCDADYLTPEQLERFLVEIEAIARHKG